MKLHSVRAGLISAPFKSVLFPCHGRLPGNRGKKAYPLNKPEVATRMRFPLKRLVIVAFALVTIAVGCFLSYRAAVGYATYFGAYHDDGIYTICAKALAEGKGYRIISLPMEPVQTKYPPGFPGILTGAFRIEPNFPKNIWIIEAICTDIAAGLLIGSAAFLVASGRATSLLALTIIAATWLNLNYLSLMPVAMADIPCTAASVLALALCEYAVGQHFLSAPEKRNSRIAPWVLIGGILSASVWTHTMGLFALAATVLYLVMQKMYRQAAIVCAIFGVIIAPSWIWALMNAATEPPTLVYYTNYIKAGSYTVSQGALPVFVAQNLALGFTELIDIVLQFLKSWSLSTDPINTEAATIYGTAWCVLLLGVAQELFKRGRYKLLAIWIVIHGIAHLMWPHGVGLRRLLAVLPFVYYYLFRGGREIGYGIKGLLRIRQVKLAVIGTPMRFKTLCAVSAVVAAGTLIGANFKESQRWAGVYAPRVPPPSQAPAGYTEASEYAETYDWIKTHTRPDDVLVWNNDPAAYLWTGRKAILSSIGESFGILVNSTPEMTKSNLLEAMRLGHGNYLIIDPISSGGLHAFTQVGLQVEALMKERRGLLTPVFTSRWGLVTIFKIDQSRL